MNRIIRKNKSVIIACDVSSIGKFRELVQQTNSIEGIGGYKVGSILVIKYGLPKIIAIVRKLTDMPIIYDHQKAMTDIPDLGYEFVKTVKEAGADALIGFPQSGPKTQESWTNACSAVGLNVIIGGEMTHPGYLQSEKGYIADEAIDQIYLLAARMGVEDFVVPGNKIDRILHYRKILKPLVKDELVFYSPGLIAQGGRITDAAKASGDYWHAIVGRAIYGATDVSKAAKEMTKEIL